MQSYPLSIPLRWHYPNQVTGLSVQLTLSLLFASSPLYLHVIILLFPGKSTFLTRFISLFPLPDCLLCTSDSIALGALKAFYQKGILIPDQLEIISIGNGNRETEEFSIPSLSVIKLPMEEMADACLQRLYRMLSTFDNTVDSIEFPIQYIARESCPE